MNRNNTSHYLFIFTCFLILLTNAEISLKSKISEMIEKGDLKDVSKLCKLKSDLSKLLRLEIDMKQTPNENGTRDVIDSLLLLSSKVDKIREKCANTGNTTENDSSMVFNSRNKDGLTHNDSKSHNIETPRVQANENNAFQKENNKSLISLKGDVIDTEEAVEMEDYVELHGKDESHGVLCEDCKMDYEDDEFIDFNVGMQTADKPKSSGGTNKLVIFFSCVGIGLVVVIVGISVVAHFGIKKINLFCNDNRNDNNRNSMSTPNQGCGEMHELS